MIHTFVNTKKKYRAGEMIITLIDTNEVINLFNNKIKLATKPNIPLGKRNLKIVKTMGRTGFLPIDLKTTSSVDFDVIFSAVHRTEEEREKTLNLFEKIEGRLVRIQLYTDPFAEYIGIISEITPENLNNFSQRYKAKVEIQPYRLFNTNSNQRTLTNGDSLKFDKGYLKVKLIVIGSGDYSISHNGLTMNFRAVPNIPLTIDCINKRVYHDASANTITDYHHVKVSKGYIELASNKPITWTGNITKVQLVYEWRSVR